MDPTNNKAAAAVYSAHNQISWRISDSASTLQTELMAIQQALSLSLHQGNGPVVIHTTHSPRCKLSKTPNQRRTSTSSPPSNNSPNNSTLRREVFASTGYPATPVSQAMTKPTSWPRLHSLPLQSNSGSNPLSHKSNLWQTNTSPNQSPTTTFSGWEEALTRPTGTRQPQISHHHQSSLQPAANWLSLSTGSDWVTSATGSLRNHWKGLVITAATSPLPHSCTTYSNARKPNLSALASHQQTAKLRTPFNQPLYWYVIS